jgi:glutamate racemase
MSIFLDTQDRQAIAAAAARAREAEIARQQAEAKAKAEAAAKARAEAAAKAKAEAEAKAKAEAAAKAQAARNRPLFMIPMANPAKPPFIGPVAPQKPGLLFMAPAATPPKPGQPGFIGPVAPKLSPADANAAFRAQERKDAQDAERKSPTSMTSAMEETRSARAEVDKALKADANKGSKETRTALESATARYGEAMQQQVRIATWQAQTRGEDDKGVKKAIEEQANAASEVGNDGGPNEMKPLAKMVADIGKEEWANQRNADVRAVQIEQVGTLRSVDPAALQAKAETDAQRVKDLQGAPGYAQESAQKQAKQSALEYAKVVAKNDGFVTKAADLLLKDAGVSLSQAQIKGDPIATAAAQKDYDQKLEAAKQASTQAELSQSMATALQNDQDATAAQKAYLDAHPGMPSKGYALLPPSDLKQKILDGNAKTAGEAGTQGDGDGIYKLSNGSRVQRLSDGQWKVLDVGKDIEPGIKKNQLLDPLTAKVWETQYQAAKSSVALDSAWTYANRQLPQAADGSQPQMPAMTADLSGQLAADKKAVQDAEALAKIQGPFTNEALQKHKDDLEIAKAKLELTDQLIQWQKTDKDYQAAKRTDSSQMCLAKTDEQYRDITDDAFVRVQRAQANLELAQSKANTAQAKIALDATPQYETPPAGAKPLTQAQPAIPPMIAAPTLNNLNSPAGSPFIGPVQKGATPPLLLTQPLLQPQPQPLLQPQVPTAAWQAANDRYNQAVQAQDQGQKKYEQAQGSEFLTSRLSTTELYDAEAVKRALAPPEEKKESHRADSILEAVVGGLEVVGGVALGVTAGWTGVGAVAAAALIADGGTRVVHGVVDAAKDEKTDPYLSQGLQQMGVDQTVANRIDTGVGLTAGLVAGGPGAVKLGVQGIRALNGVRVAGQAGEAFTVAQVAGAGGKVLAGAGSTAMLADMSYAQGSYVVTGEMKTPLGTQGLMKMGLSETQANYVQVLGGLGVGAGASTVKWAAPKVKAATTARNATAGAAATQVVAGQQGATAPGTAPAGTTGTTTTGTTTTTGSTTTGTTTTGTGAGTTTTGTPTGTTPAGTTPAGTPPVNNTPASGNNTAATGNQSTGSGSGVNAPDLQTKTGGAKPRGNVYNDTLVLGNNLSSEKIFQQGAVLQGADTTVNALTAAVKKKGDAANVVIATGRSDAKGVLDAGGPASAAHTGRAMRIYAEKELGARITPTYVVDRQNMPLMRAALEAAGETPDAYKLVTFNARGRWAEGRSRAFTKKHDPDLMVAVDVPGRTGDRQYLNADGGQITKFNSARDRLFTEAENRGVPTVAALERGHEVGGGAKSVFNRVDPAANGTEIASVVPAGVPVVAGKASWASYALSTELLRRADALDQAPSGKQVRDTVAAVESAGGRSSANTSPVVEGTVAELLKSQAARMGENKPVGPDLRGRTIRVGVFDSGSGGILGADVIKASIEQRTGATVELVPAGDHGAGTYGPKTKTEIADLTRSGLETLEKSDVDLVVMACNTACTSGKPLYAAGIRVPVIDLILSTREYHKTLVGQGKKVVAFSTEATAKLDLPKEYQVLEGLNQEVKIYEDTHVTPVGGTDGPILNEKTKAVTNPKEVAAYDARWAKFRAEYEQRTGTDMSKVAGIDQSDLNLANLVNRYLPDKASPELTARLEFAADHYVDKILKAAPDTDTISWCCTHYPELKPFVQKALDARGKGSIEMVNPMEFHALKAIDELAVQPPGVGISRGGTVAITTAVPDKVAAAKDPSIPAERRTMDIKDVADTVPVVIQQPERPIVGLPRFGRDVDNTPVIDALKNLNRNTIDELRAYDPPGRARSIIISDSPAFAADQLMQSQKPMVVTGIPVRVGRGNKYRPDSDGIKGAAEMASA